ncbi:hypothetical protein J500_0349 [Acinetobacter sp. 479375]|nr:hypothetical protein J500_0349 [Acinetobacter sp. 479375]
MAFLYFFKTLFLYFKHEKMAHFLRHIFLNKIAKFKTEH